MKTNVTFKHILLAMTIMVSIAACKKDEKSPEPAPAEIKAITLTDLKALSTGASVKVPDAKKITGIVISDTNGKNIDSKSIVLQEADNQTGIIVSFDAAPAFAAGDQVEVNISNQTMAQVNGEVVLQDIPAANAKKTGTGIITAKATTTADIVTNKAAWDGTLVTLSEGSFSDGDGKYTGSLTYNDTLGAITSNVLADAVFANTAYPAAVTNITGIVRVNGTNVSIDIRNVADVIADATIVRSITEDFSTTVWDDVNLDFTTTPVGKWASGYALYKTPYAEDDFLQAGKKYLHIFTYGSAVSPGAYSVKGNFGPETLDYDNLKTASITFAGSKFAGVVSPYGPGFDLTSYPFDPAKHTIEVQLTLRGNLGGVFYIPIAKATFSDVGIFHTVTFKLPEPTAEAYKAALLKMANPFTPGVNFTDADANQAAVSIYQSDKLFEFKFAGSSDRSTDPNETKLFIVEKIVLGFSK